MTPPAGSTPGRPLPPLPPLRRRLGLGAVGVLTAGVLLDVLTLWAVVPGATPVEGLGAPEALVSLAQLVLGAAGPVLALMGVRRRPLLLVAAGLRFGWVVAAAVAAQLRGDALGFAAGVLVGSLALLPAACYLGAFALARGGLAGVDRARALAAVALGSLLWGAGAAALVPDRQTCVDEPTPSGSTRTCGTVPSTPATVAAVALGVASVAVPVRVARRPARVSATTSSPGEPPAAP